MAYNFEYPYTDPYRYNSDALKNEVAELQKAPKIYTFLVSEPLTADMPVGSIAVVFRDSFRTTLFGVFVKCEGENNFTQIWSQ